MEIIKAKEDSTLRRAKLSVTRYLFGGTAEGFPFAGLFYTWHRSTTSRGVYASVPHSKTVAETGVCTSRNAGMWTILRRSCLLGQATHKDYVCTKK